MNQKWAICSLGDGTFFIASAAEAVANGDKLTFVLDAAGEVPEAGANVGLWKWNGGRNQEWVFIDIEPASTDESA